MPYATAQEGNSAAPEEIVVVGTRRKDRTSVDTPVPVDVFNQEDLASVPSPELLDTLNTLVPSMNVGRYPRGDGASFIRPPTLRGLDSDKTLVLVNGKRRHRGSLVILNGFGSHGPDLATLPSIALRNIEVLRDGASAFYGSDAIAGVINFNLKDAAEGGELLAQYGEYDENNESTYRISGNAGLPLGDNGFVNISFEYNDAEQTSRGIEWYTPTIARSGLTPEESAMVSGFYDHDGDPNTPDQERFGPDAMTEVFAAGQLVSIIAGTDGIPDDTDTRYADNFSSAELTDSNLLMLWGRPNRDSIQAIINTGYDLSENTTVYGWANYSDANADRNQTHRRPGSRELTLLRTPNGDIYDPRELYPSGFTPRYFGEIVDQSVTAGVRGQWNSGLTYDFGGRYGHSEIRYSSKNTMNPSLGPETPTSFRPGSLVSDEGALTADFTLPLSFSSVEDSFLAFGVEYREEGYKSKDGDTPSYVTGPYAFSDPWDFETSPDEAANGDNGGIVECRVPGLESVGTPCPPGDPVNNVAQVGSVGFAGYSPQYSFDYRRDSWSVYADLETDITNEFLVTVAARYEDFSDYGNNLSGQLAARYAPNDRFTLRGSVGTGFRAPTPGQIATISVRTIPGITTDPELTGIFPANSIAAQLFGAVPLDAETSSQWTIGIGSTPVDWFTFTLDYYHIAVDDRLYMSSSFDVGPLERAALIALGVPNADAITEVSFFNNDIDTETDGIDLVATMSFDWSAGLTRIAASANWNDTEVTGRTPRPDGFFMDDVDKFNVEHALPEYRFILDVSHTWANDVTLSFRGQQYGDYAIEFSRRPGTFQNFDGVFQVDTMLSWNLADDRFNVALGANNISNERSDLADFGVCCGQIYRDDSVIDWQGRYYYIRGSYRWR